MTQRDKPLRRGVWFHELLEVHYRGEDWTLRHAILTNKFLQLFDEEKEALGDLPKELYSLMQSYLWHYGANRDDPYHDWTVLETELTLECPWPDGEGVYRGRIDILYEDRWGLWIGDHKTNKVLPDTSFRLLDKASALYIWAARECGYPVDGFVWNYIRTKVPTKPALVYKGKPNARLSTRSIETDYPTFVRALREYDLDPKQYKQQLRFLKSQRWQPDAVQTSPFFQRSRLEKDEDLLARVIGSAMRTRDRMNTYDWNDTETIERVEDRSCKWTCDYTALCETELFSGHSSIIRNQQYRIGDPLDYYQDQPEVPQ